MSKPIFAALVLTALAGVISLGTGTSFAAPGNSGTWKGYVTDTYCGVNRDTKVPTRACTIDCIKNKNAQLAFYSLEDKTVYVLTPQDMATKYEGQLVTVTGTIGETITPIKTMKGAGSAKTITASAITPAK